MTWALRSRTACPQIRSSCPRSLRWRALLGGSGEALPAETAAVRRRERIRPHRAQSRKGGTDATAGSEERKEVARSRRERRTCGRRSLQLYGWLCMHIVFILCFPKMHVSPWFVGAFALSSCSIPLICVCIPSVYINFSCCLLR